MDRPRHWTTERREIRMDLQQHGGIMDGKEQRKYFFILLDIFIMSNFIQKSRFSAFMIDFFSVHKYFFTSLF